MSLPAESPANLGRVPRETLQDRVYEELKRAIMSGAFPLGSGMTTRGLAAAVGTSPMPVRDALHRLVAERALELLPNRTVQLPEITPERFDEIRRVRLLLEGSAAAEAAKAISTAELGELARINEDMRRASRDARAFLASNQAFHFAIYRASRNSVLLPIIESLWLQAGPLLNHVTTELGLEAATHRHTDMIAALRARSARAARKVVEEDINDAARIILAHMRRSR